MSGTVVTIGNFDGVHAGHRALISRARELASEYRPNRADVVALAFEPNPQLLLGGIPPARLSTWEQRERWLLSAGADRVDRLEPTRELLALEPEEFIRNKVERLKLVGIVEGPDFRFGKGRHGDITLLRSLGKEHGFQVAIVPEVQLALTDHILTSARSNTIRWLLERGRVADAAILLGRPFQLDGVVVQGNRRGRTIGFPTVNVDSPNMIPSEGVYAGRAALPNGRALNAAISIGTKPTFGQHARAVEAFLWHDRFEVRLSGTTWRPIDELSEYGWAIQLDFVGWIRDQVRFGSVRELTEQLHRDCRRIDQMLHSQHASSATLAGLGTQR